MPRRQRRRYSLLEEEQQEVRLFETVARHFGVPITDIRRTTHRFHNGDNLTVAHQWHVRTGGAWHSRDYQPTQGSTGPYNHPK